MIPLKEESLDLATLSILAVDHQISKDCCCIASVRDCFAIWTCLRPAYSRAEYLRSAMQRCQGKLGALPERVQDCSVSGPRRASISGVKADEGRL